jgi:Na+-driven multidrug efflux pump
VFLLRLLIFFVLVTVGASGVLYLFTRNKRYLKFAWLVLKFAFVFVIVLGVLFVLERLILI